MLASFYLISLVPLTLGTLIALALKQREMALRGGTLLTLLHLICGTLWWGPLAFIGLIMAVVAIGGYELSRSDPIQRLLVAGLGVLYFVLLLIVRQVLPLLLPFTLVLAVMAFMSPSRLVRHPAFLAGLMGLLVVPFAVFIVALMDLHMRYIITLIFLLQLNDIFGLLFGRLVGRTHLFPTISPHKTLEGYLLGGVGILSGLVLLHTYIPVFPATYSWYKSACIGAYFWVFGNLGDLLFSSLKRKLQIKDFGNLLPGHGGVLDRFDNILFVAPGWYVLVRWMLMGT